MIFQRTLFNKGAAVSALQGFVFLLPALLPTRAPCWRSRGAPPPSVARRIMRGGRGQPLLIVILAWNRPESLRRLLNSLERADYGAAPASMEVRFALDATGNTTMDSEMDAVIDALRWPHGDVLVRCVRSLRLRRSCLASPRRTSVLCAGAGPQGLGCGRTSWDRGRAPRGVPPSCWRTTSKSRRCGGTGRRPA